MTRSPSSLFILIVTTLELFGCGPSQSPPLVLQSFGSHVLSVGAIVLERIPEPSPEDKAAASTLRVQGLDLRNQGRFEEAIATLQQAVELDSRELSGYVILGWTQHLAIQRDDAEATLLNALNYDPHHVPALNALGIVYLVDGQLDDAVHTHTQALDLKPDNEIAAYNLSLAYQRLQRYDEAIDHAVLATELEPDNPHPWVALAIAHESSTNHSEAVQAYQQALNLDSRYGSQAHLAHLEQAGFSSDQIQLTEAILRHGNHQDN